MGLPLGESTSIVRKRFFPKRGFPAFSSLRYRLQLVSARLMVDTCALRRISPNSRMWCLSSVSSRSWLKRLNKSGAFRSAIRYWSMQAS